MRILPRLLGLFTIVTVAAPARAQVQSPRSEFVAAIADDLLLRAFADLSSDSMQGRRIASPGSLKAREYIVRQLKQLGVEPLVPEFIGSFQAQVPDIMSVPAAPQNRGATSILGAPTPTARRLTRSAIGSNILGVVRGTAHPDRYIVVSAHYDHVGIVDGRLHAGANDNASGVAALFAIADLLTAAKPKNSVILAFFDGEELGMLGSKAFTRNPPVPLRQVAANVNIDMIGRTQDDALYFVGEKQQPRMSALASVVSAAGTVRIVPGHDGRDSREDLFQRSDQWTFHQRGIPAILFAAEELEDHHTPRDIAAKVNVAFYIRAVSAISDFVRRLDESLDDVVAKPR